VDLARHEVIVLDNDSSDPETLGCFERLAQRGVRIIRIGGPFNFARLVNKGASIASGEFLLVLDGVTALATGWLDEMLGRMGEPDVGAVGATLLSPTGVAWHCGFALGPGFDAAPAFSDRMDGDAGYGDLLRVAHEVSAVTAACLLTRRLFLEAGGFDGQHFPVKYHDVDYCLRLRARGLRIVQTPHVKLLQMAASGAFQPSERLERETRDLRAIWGEVLAADPYYNPLLSLDQIPFTGLAWPPRASGPRQNYSAPPCVLPPGF
jgi:GT2 family glycosyltransferase